MLLAGWLPDRLKLVRQRFNAGLLVDQAVDVGEGRALGEEVAHAGDGIGVAGNLRFDRAVGTIPDPAAYFELLRLFDGPCAEADALDPAGDEYSNAIHDEVPV